MPRASQGSSEIELVEGSQRKPLGDDSSVNHISLHYLVTPNPNLPSVNSVHAPENPGEHEPPEAGKLRAIDVFGFIVNKMIGTGIYTNPALVLIFTGSRKAAISFWIVGLTHTFVSMFIYLSCASVIPYNTGELVYLDEFTSNERPSTPDASRNLLTKKLRLYMGNGLFAYTIYAFLFIGTFNSATNCMQVGRQILTLISPHDESPSGSLLRFIAIVALTVVCLLHYFSPAWGRALNLKFALTKIALLLALVIAGGVSWARHEAIARFDTSMPIDKSDYAKALLLVVFAFEGWENANFIAGEIPRNSHHVLRRGFLWAVTVVGTLYIAINTIFLFGLVEYSNNMTPQVGHEPFSALEGDFDNRGTSAPVTANTSIAPLFFGNSTAAVRCWGFFTAWSAIGSVISIVYTFSRVKQAIGRMNILPWSITWGADDDRRHPPETGDLEKTPMGGLILHWITTVTSILATIQIHDILNAINFPGLLQSVAHAVILIPLSLGFFRLRSRAAALGFEREKLRPVDRFLTSIWYDNNVWVLSILAAVILAYAACNVFFVVDFIIPPYDGVDGWVPLAFVAFFVALAVSYYFSFFGSYLPDPDAEDSNFRDDIGPETQGPPEKMRFSFLALADVEMTIRKADTFDESTQEAQRFGSRRKIRYQDGDDANFLYWFFGGRNLDESPWAKFRESWNRYVPWI